MKSICVSMSIRIMLFRIGDLSRPSPSGLSPCPASLLSSGWIPAGSFRFFPQLPFSHFSHQFLLRRALNNGIAFGASKAPVSLRQGMEPLPGALAHLLDVGRV